MISAYRTGWYFIFSISEERNTLPPEGKEKKAPPPSTEQG